MPWKRFLCMDERLIQGIVFTLQCLAAWYLVTWTRNFWQSSGASLWIFMNLSVDWVSIYIKQQPPKRNHCQERRVKEHHISQTLFNSFTARKILIYQYYQHSKVYQNLKKKLHGWSGLPELWFVYVPGRVQWPSQV